MIQPKWDSSEWWVCEADTFSGLCGQVNPPWVENCEYCRAPRGLVDRRKHVVERPPVVSEHYFEPNQVVKSANVVRVERVSLASKVFSGILRLIGFSP